MNNSVFWDISSCIPLKINGSLGRTFSLHLQGPISQARNFHVAGSKLYGVISQKIDFLIPWQFAYFCLTNLSITVSFNCPLCRQCKRNCLDEWRHLSCVPSMRVFVRAQLFKHFDVRPFE
jgi:hypothetical protein